jgi:hypothetical protein
MSLPSRIEPSTVSLNRLFRVKPEVYQGMVKHGLLPRDRKVVLVDGLLVDEGAKQLHPLSLAVYEGMVEYGLLTKYDKIELLDGLMVQKVPKGDPPQVCALGLMYEALIAMKMTGWHVRTKGPIALSDGPTGRPSVPEPDVVFVRGGVRAYRMRKPNPDDLALIAEVADSSLRKDRDRLARYAWSKVPSVWIINLTDECIEVYEQPTGPATPAQYNVTTIHGPDDEVPVRIDGREVGRLAVKDILP